MGPYLESLPTTISLPNQSTLLSKLKTQNETELKKLEEKIEDAKNNLGETEISEALKTKAYYLAKIGYKVRIFWIKCYPLLCGSNEPHR